MSRLVVDSFLFFYLRFTCYRICEFVRLARLFSSGCTCFANLSNQVSRVLLTAKKIRKKANFIFQCSSLFYCGSVSSLLNIESLVRRTLIIGQSVCSLRALTNLHLLHEFSWYSASEYVPICKPEQKPCLISRCINQKKRTSYTF